MARKKIKEEDDDNEFNIDKILNEKPKKRIRRTKEELKPNYVDPKEMEALIVSYYKTGYLDPNLADMIQKIATRLGYAHNFLRYSYKEEMIGDAVIKMITALTRKRFKCDSGYNPFSYFTKVAYRAFQNRIKKEKKEHETLHRYQDEVYNVLRESGNIPFQKNTRYESPDNNTFHTQYH